MKRKLLVLNLALLLVMSLVVACGSAPTVTVTAPAGTAPTVTVTAPGGAGATTTVTVTATPSPTPTVTSTQTYSLTFAWSHDLPNVKVFEIFRPGGEFQRMISDRSNGRLQVKIIEKMFPSMEQLPSAMMGKADLADIQLPNYSGTYPFMSWAEVPALIPDPTEAMYEEIAVYRDPRMRQIWAEQHNKIGLQSLIIGQGGSGNLLATKKVITKVDDLKGLKVRVYGALAAQGMKTLGAAPVTMPLAEVEAGVMTGVVEGVLSGPLYLNRSGLAKVVPNMVYLPLAPIWTNELVMNLQKFNSLPADLQKVLLDVSSLCEYMITSSNSSEITMAVLAIGYQGGKIANLDAAEFAKALELVKPIRQDWLKTAGPVGEQILAIADDVITKYKAFKP